MNNQRMYQYLESVVGMMPGNVYWKDRQGVYLGCNDNAARVVGLSSRHEVVGKRLSDFVSQDIANAVEKMDEEIMQRGEITTVEEKAFDPTGNSVTYLTRKVPLKDEYGNVVGLVGISFDVTDRKKFEKDLVEDLIKAKEKAEAANQAKTEFIRNISHDLRTPFSGLLGLTKMLYEQENDELKKEQLGYVVDSAKTLLDIIENVLSISMLEAENYSLKLVPFSLSASVKQIIDLLTLEAQQKKLALSWQIDADVPARLVGDVVRLDRILLNLISNAIKFTHQGSVELIVRVVARRANEVTLCFEVKDTGIGIPANRFQDIFECFNRLTPSYQGIYPGMGIGLYIVKKFVDQLHGKVWVESELGKGSSFYCQLTFMRIVD